LATVDSSRQTQVVFIYSFCSSTNQTCAKHLHFIFFNIKKRFSCTTLQQPNQQNNLANFAMPRQFEAAVPSGTGIVIVGSDKTIIQNNKIRNNNFVGIAVVSTLILEALVGLPPEAFADIEPNPDGTRV
jgi:parallel beta-helix repeat protein